MATTKQSILKDLEDKRKEFHRMFEDKRKEFHRMFEEKEKDFSRLEPVKTDARKAQATGTFTPPPQRAAIQPEERARKKSGTGGEVGFYHIALRRSEDFETFRIDEEGEAGHIQRVAGKRGSGSWVTVEWRISKEDAHIDRGNLVPDSGEAKKALSKLGSQPVQVKGDLFEAKPQPNAPAEKPEPASKPARSKPVRKAQAAEQKATGTAGKKPASAKKPARSQSVKKAQAAEQKATGPAEKKPAPAKKPARSQSVSKAQAARRK